MRAVVLLLALGGCATVQPVASDFVRDVQLSPADRCAQAAEAYDTSGHTLLDGALVVIACADAFPGP
jgi:hypothetical protein